MPLMTVVPGECEEAIAGLRADPVMAGLLGPEALALMWDLSGAGLLWASPAAAELARSLADGEGRIYPDLPFGHWLRTSGRAVAPVRRLRLERVRLGTDRIASPTLLACRRLALGHGEALLTIVVGAVPALRPRTPAPSKAHTPETRDDPPAATFNEAGEPERASPDPVADLRALPARRFVWAMDAAGRFTAISGSLAEVVGAENANVTGRRWSDIVGRLVLDPTNGVEEALAAQAVWSNRPVLWRLADGRHLIPVTMSGAPVRGPQRSLEGFRGFGIGRPSEIVADANFVAAVEAGTTANEADVEQPGVEPIAEPTKRSTDVVEAPAPEASVPDQVPVETDGIEPVPESQPDTPPEAAAEPPSAARRDETPPEAPGYTYAAAPPGLMPMFQVLLDASLSGLSNMLSALPNSERRTGAGTASEPLDPGAAAPPSGEAEAVQEPEFVQAHVETAVPAGEAPDRETEAALEARDPVALQGGRVEFGVLQTRVGGRLGGSRSVAVQLPAQLGETGPSGAEPGPYDAEQAPPILSFAERGALHEIARALGARLEGPDEGDAAVRRASAEVVQIPQQPRARELARLPDQIPLGLLVHRGDALLYANRFLLDLAGSDDGGAAAPEDVPALFRQGLDPSLEPGHPPTTALIMAPGGSTLVECRTHVIEWGEAPASLQLVTPLDDADPALRRRALELDLAQRDRRLDELAAVLDLAADGIVILDEAGRVVSVNGGVERLFGYAQNEIIGEPITILLAPESHASVLTAIAALAGEERSGTGAETRDVIGRTRAGGLVPLSIVLGAIDTTEPSVCVVIRDVSRQRELEATFASATLNAEDADKQRTDFLARLSHEIRTPLNAIIGFSELMIEERFGSGGSERHLSYLADIRESGRHVLALVDDLLDLSRMQSGELATAPKGLDLNEVVTQGVTALQPVAARERIVVRTSFASGLAPVMADDTSLRQIVANVLSHAIERSDAGGQVIASTAASDSGDVAFRVRDAGRAISEAEIEAALQPFRQLPAGRGGEGTGLGLPLAKALVEAHRGSFAVTSRPREGTLVEVLLPAARTASEGA
jgi:PAS domain S-box-containing protein